MPGIHASAERLLKGKSIRLGSEQALQIIEQFKETCAWRGWLLVAAAVMANHCHVVLGVPGDPEPATLLRDLKSYASRRLNTLWPSPESGTWWTESGSRRKLGNEAAILGASRYVRDQEYPLAMWIEPTFANELGSA